MRLIPIAPVPAQKFNIVLGEQNCQISLYQKSNDVFIDISVSNVPIIVCALCVDRVKVVRSGYLGFVGNIAFADTQGVIDPDYKGFGDRYRLVYLEAGEL